MSEANHIKEKLVNEQNAKARLVLVKAEWEAARAKLSAVEDAVRRTEAEREECFEKAVGEDVIKVVGESIVNAATDGNIEALRDLLCMKGADINHENEYGNTALIVASSRGHPDVVRDLLARGADVNHASTVGYTSLLLASMQGHTEIVGMLLEKGADVRHIDHGRCSALTFAYHNHHTEIIEMLKKRLSE